MQARYVILRVLMENTPPGCVTVQRTTGSDGQPDLLVELDETLIVTAGRKAIGDFLEKLQVCMSLCFDVIIRGNSVSILPVIHP